MSKLIRVIAVGLVLACVLMCLLKSAQKTSAQATNAVSSKLSPEKMPDFELSKISAETLNRFHLALIARVLLMMPEELQLSVEYGGIVASDNGRNKLRVVGSIGAPLEWSVFGADGVGVFWLTISSQRSNDTVSACRVGKETVFVNIIGIDGLKVNEKNLAVPMKALGGRSVLEVVKLLESAPGRFERQ